LTCCQKYIRNFGPFIYNKYNKFRALLFKKIEMNFFVSGKTINYKMTSVRQQQRFHDQPQTTFLFDPSPTIHQKYLELENYVEFIKHSNLNFMESCQQWMGYHLNIHTTRIIAHRYFGIISIHQTKLFCIKKISEKLLLADLIRSLSQLHEFVENQIMENQIMENPSTKRYLSNIHLFKSENKLIRPADSCLEDCPICYGDDIQKKNTLSTNCGHIFCKDCICTCIDKTSMQNIPTCPMCREDITSLTALEEEVYRNLVSKYT